MKIRKAKSLLGRFVRCIQTTANYRCDRAVRNDVK